MRALLAALTLLIGSLAVPAAAAQAAADVNLAAGKTATASSFTDVYRPANLTDGNQATYWESANNAFPQWAQVDLGAAASLSKVVLKLPNGWPGRTETLTVQGSTNGSSFTTLAASATYTISPAATVTLPAGTTARYVRVHITANSGWPAGQLSELEVWGSTQDNPGPGPDGPNLALGKTMTESGHTHTYAAANANDDNLQTYWEGGAYPATLTAQLGANADLTAVTLKLNPDPVWGRRTQTLQVLGREQSATSFTTLAAQATYTFDPATGNTVTIPVSGKAADVRLQFTGNSGAPSGQVAEFQIFGTPAPNPDLTVSGLSSSPAAPVETDAVTLSATVKNTGTAASAATTVNFYAGTAKAGSADVGALAAGASTTVSANIGTKEAGTYQLSAKVDEDNKVIEQNEANNATTGTLTVKPVDTADLIAAPVAWTPGNPAAGSTVTFSVAIRNQGTIASGAGAHGITFTVADGSGNVVKTLTGSISGAIAAGATTSPVTLGTWTAANGRYTVKTVLADDANELPVKRANNTSTLPLFVGRGANMPYDTYEAEDAAIGGGAARVGPSREIGTIAGEASGRRAVTLNQTGAYVEFTTRADTNTLVTRFSMPDAPGGGGQSSTLNVYVNGSFLKAINLTSRYAWLYGAEASPNNNPSSGPPRHIYDEANLLLGTTVPKGSKIRLQKDTANSLNYAIDFVDFELATQIPNPDPAKYAVPTGFGHQDVQNALDKARMDANLSGVYLPPGDYQTNGKFQVYGKAVKVVGAGPWFTRFSAPAGQSGTDIGFRAEASANGSVFSGFAYFGNYVERIDGPGKVFDFNNVANMTIDNVWIEHQICMLWGSNTDNLTIRNSRIRNTFADGLNMTNGSTGNHVTNVETRSTGDDSFALFSAIDNNAGEQTGNVFENLTSLLTWRAAGLAVYGGYDNTFRNIYIADTLVYSGVTISSLDFGIPMLGFGASPPTTFDNISLVRAGGHFWGQQTFPAMWLFSSSKVFQGIRVSNLDIVDPTYSGIMFQTGYSSPSTPLNPIKDTAFTNVSISGAQRSGDAFDAKSGFGIWVNELPEPGQGPAIGSATFTNLRFSNNYQNIRNTTSTFTLTIN
ncbi:putative secreted protein [[Actinomadura] parvosata subsp. kistnae]|uniref:Glycosyl hydrolase n=1 Tax=[Actinomadura] parvosata subsp. kistnae TaxID=1909395 RepID=A0A1V0A7W4_9ACTN|nr:discoidin domain-containing protein [Nonomuraea sp. ATCC 55076]AQZ66308.1 glycosyl hydrolase [Nonomuraea sp. ATCC 55076]SPL95677.1 putative secreted protein [Actinomadura parvosata subsp. kistnae]